MTSDCFFFCTSSVVALRIFSFLSEDVNDFFHISSLLSVLPLILQRSVVFCCFFFSYFSHMLEVGSYHRLSFAPLSIFRREEVERVLETPENSLREVWSLPMNDSFAG